jgi:dihydropteroate synthase
MGVLNLTPDSFSGDGLGEDVETAVALGLAFQEQGADAIDVGGESTRPAGPVYGAGAMPVSEQEEIRRVIPVIERLRDALSIPVSIDTYKAAVARRAVEAGATIINDVWALKRDPDMAQVVAETGVALILVHNQHGTEYRDLLREVVGDLRQSVQVALDAGVVREQMIVDPGIGFGKTAQDNLRLLRRLDEFKSVMGRPLLVGTSRKSTIGQVLGGLPADQRVEGTAATVALAIAKGADMVRVHDVQAMTRVARMSDAIVRGWQPPEP